MIIKLEADGQPACIETSAEKAQLEAIILPEQTYHPLRVHAGYASSISTSDSNFTATHELNEKREEDEGMVGKSKRWRLFASSRSRHQPSTDPLTSGHTMVGRQEEERAEKSWPRWLSSVNIDRKWAIVWIVSTLVMCIVVAVGVWLATKDDDKTIFVQPKHLPGDRPPQLTNLYGMPYEQFGCYESTAEVIFNGSQTLYFVPVGNKAEHALTLTGGATGVLTIASAPDLADPQEIIYDVFIRGDRSLLDDIVLEYPPRGPTTIRCTEFIIDTPDLVDPAGVTNLSPCMYYEITMYIPRGLRKIDIHIDTPVQMKFSPQSHIDLDNLHITLTSLHEKTELIAHESLQAGNMSIDTANARILGAFSIDDELRIVNDQGETNLDVIPNTSTDLENPLPAILSTTTGTGSVSITYLRNQAYRKRTIRSTHIVQGKSCEGFFDYRQSTLVGLVSANMSELLKGGRTLSSQPANLEGEDASHTWTHFAGDVNGADRVVIQSQSSTGKLILPFR
ncbi:unnamed protein product [Cyclocybe aegerita]|uniref:Uncharacterized protein n=1 Tax=Cyclocybe aegerita TaxID=1973307 RepID=A0A8S0XPC8_CYCAE|nr:unnamed protein product [Cyclocybe aegerita]